MVRGTTSRKIVRMVRAAGAKEVHVRISCPPTISPCFYGVDTPRRSELIAATHTLEEIREFLEADSVAYLSLEGLMSAVGSERSSYCSSCYTGDYPVEFPRDEATYLQLALKLDKGDRQGAGREMIGAAAARLARTCSVVASCRPAVRRRRRSPAPGTTGAAGRLARAAPSGHRQARQPRLRHPRERVAHGPAHARRRRRCRR